MFLKSLYMTNLLKHIKRFLYITYTNMCGIFSYFGTQFDFNMLKKNFDKIQKRGPDNSVIQLINDKYFFGFHRLSINDVSEKVINYLSP